MQSLIFFSDINYSAPYCALASCLSLCYLLTMETFEEREERERLAVASFSYAKPICATPNAAQTPIDEVTLAKLDTMSQAELVQLIRRVSGAMWGIGLLSPTELAAAFKLKLAIGGLSEKDMFKALPIMREWFDRELGKAPQSIAMTVKDDGLGKMATDRLLRLAAMLDEPVLISPEPKRLSDSDAYDDAERSEAY